MNSFAIVPAAGRSERMGRPKLLLAWGASTVIEHVIATWRASRVQRVVLIAHPDDGELVALAAAAGAEVVRPAVPPPDMRASVQEGLDYLECFHPAPLDAWLVAPADMPGLRHTTIDRLIETYAAAVSAQPEPPVICLPYHSGKRGHPALFAWKLASKVAALPAGQGLNRLMDTRRVLQVEVGEDAISADLDTLDEYERLRGRLGM